MTESEPAKKRRMGPVGFRGEAKVTSLRGVPASNDGGMGEASGPFLETSSGTKELRVAGPLLLGVSGLAVLLLGLLFNLIVAIVGFGMIVFAILTTWTNKIERRVRSDFEE